MIKSPLFWLRISLGIIYLWFGTLKFFHGQSPAEQLAKDTIDSLSFHILPVNVGYFILALWEVILGTCFLFGICNKAVMSLFFLHLAGTFTPLIILRAVSFHDFPYGFTLVGQYIMKNLVFLVAGWLLWIESGKEKSTV